MLLFIILQTNVPQNVIVEESFISLLLKGGWILLPLFLLSLLAVYVIIERWLVIDNANWKKEHQPVVLKIAALIKDGSIEKARSLCSGFNTSSAKVIQAGLSEIDNDLRDIEDSMEVEARQEMSKLETNMNYLGITASIAPMLGFLGTIFGVIKIFYNISVTNDLSISSISDGLYQKMICSGVGLFVGIIAYAGFYVLNGKIDKVVSRADKDANEILKAIRQYKGNN